MFGDMKTEQDQRSNQGIKKKEDRRGDQDSRRERTGGRNWFIGPHQQHQPHTAPVEVE